MKTTAIALSLMLGLVPGLAAAACSDHSAQTMSCADGQVYDSETRSCVPTTS
jgi:hypothetical protein